MNVKRMICFVALLVASFSTAYASDILLKDINHKMQGKSMNPYLISAYYDDAESLTISSLQDNGSINVSVVGDSDGTLIYSGTLDAYAGSSTQLNLDELDKGQQYTIYIQVGDALFEGTFTGE